MIGVVKGLIEVTHAREQLVDQTRRPGAVPDHGEVVLTARHHLEVFFVNRAGVLRCVARAQERARRQRVFGAEVMVDLDDAVVTLARVVVARKEVRSRGRCRADARRP